MKGGRRDRDICINMFGSLKSYNIVFLIQYQFIRRKIYERLDFYDKFEKEGNRRYEASYLKT